jgi:FkbM family methyltransferase
MMLHFLRLTIARSIPFILRRFVPNRIYKHLYFQGIFQMRYKGRKLGKIMHSGTIVENDVYWRGLDHGHEPLSMCLWIEIVKKMQPQLILDIGANTGLYGVVAKNVYPNASVHFFEPAPAAQNSIFTSLRANHIYDGAWVHEVFLSDETNPRKKLFANSPLDFSHVYEGKQGNTNEISIEREVWKLADLFNSKHPELRTESIDLVKIDIEGHEFRALKGFENYLSKDTIYLIEVLDDSAANSLCNLFSPSDYLFVNLDDNTCTMKIQEELTRSFKWNILIVPRSKFSIVEKILIDNRNS